MTDLRRPRDLPRPPGLGHLRVRAPTGGGGNVEPGPGRSRRLGFGPNSRRTSPRAVSVPKIRHTLREQPPPLEGEPALAQERSTSRPSHVVVAPRPPEPGARGRIGLRRSRGIWGPGVSAAPAPREFPHPATRPPSVQARELARARVGGWSPLSRLNVRRIAARKRRGAASRGRVGPEPSLRDLPDPVSTFPPPPVGARTRPGSGPALQHQPSRGQQKPSRVPQRARDGARRGRERAGAGGGAGGARGGP